MDRPTLNLKDPAVQARYIGRHIDDAIDAILSGGYQSHIVYNDCDDVPPKSEREVVVHVDDVTNKVRSIR